MTDTLRVACWNVFNRDRGTERLLACVDKVDADVVALQELTTAHVAALGQRDGYRLHTAEDFREGDQPTYLGLLTRRPAADHTVVAHNGRADLSPSWMGRRLVWRECLESQSLAVAVGDRLVRVVNLHLTCGAPPRVRSAQLRQALAGHTTADQPAVVCGDFNSFGAPVRNLVAGWAFGYRPQDLFGHDIAEIDRIAASAGLRRVFKHVVTYPRLGLQLDHMLVSRLRCTRSRVGDDRFGSDHRPLVADLAL